MLDECEVHLYVIIPSLLVSCGIIPNEAYSKSIQIYKSYRTMMDLQMVIGANHNKMHHITILHLT